MSLFDSDSSSATRSNRKRGLGCGGCLLVLVGLFGVSRATDVWDKFWEEKEQEEQREEQLEKRNAIESDVQQFASEQAPGLKKALDDLGDIRTRDEQRLKKLAETLTALDRKPEEDPDYARLKNRVAEMERKQDELTRQLEEAYLLWQKFLISRNPEEQKRYEDALRTGQKTAEDTNRRMRELREEFESGR